MTDAKEMLAVVLLGLCVLAGVAHGFVVEQSAGADSAWQFSTLDGNARGGRLVSELKDFQIKGFGSYDAGVAGSGDVANVNQFSDNTFADLPEQFSTSDFNYANQFQEQEGQFDTQESSGGSGDKGYVYNARLQSRGAPEFETNDVNADNAAPYDYNRFSTLPEGFSAPASQLNRQPSSASYVLGVPEEREEEARPEYAYDARAGSNGAKGASFTTLDLQGASDDQAVPAKDVGKASEPADESLPAYVYDGRADSGKESGSADGASFTTTESVQQESLGDQVVPAKGHEGPVSYYTPSSDRNGAFVFYDTRSDEQKKLGSKVDGGSAGGASFTSSDTATTASTSPILPTQQAPQGTHGCPNSYWAEHVGQWPSPLKITTLVSQAFRGSSVKTNLEIVYGTTTLFQALLDTRDDPYSKLLRHAVAALLNAHAKTGYILRPHEVAKLFNAALASKAAAASQAQKFENENHAFGDNECK